MKCLSDGSVDWIVGFIWGSGGSGRGFGGCVMGGLVSWSMSRMRLSGRVSRMRHCDQDVAVARVRRRGADAMISFI